MKVLHTADLHFSNKPDKLLEVITVTNFILTQAAAAIPGVAVLAGDTLDEHDGPIRIDSEAARAAIRFVTSLAEICPVVIIRGTRSHDRETPYIFQHLKSKHPIYVGTKIEMVALAESVCIGPAFMPLEAALDYPEPLDIKSVFTLIPSPDKSNLISAFGGESIAATTLIAKECLHDVLAYIGEANSQVPAGIPRILVGHGMITGSQYSSGTLATGEDFEFGVSDLALTNTDLKAFGHVHKQQSFPGNIHYSGSPGRLNMGETEVKGFLVHTLDGNKVTETRFIETPARRFVLYDVPWESLDNIMLQAAACESECAGADVRFRYTIPQENRHQVNRDELAARFEAAGAKLVKIEPTIIPKTRVRAAGISRLETLPEKILKWGETTSQVIPQRVLDIATTIEGRSVEELIEDAKLPVYGNEPFAELKFAEADEVVEQGALF